MELIRRAYATTRWERRHPWSLVGALTLPFADREVVVLALVTVLASWTTSTTMVVGGCMCSLPIAVLARRQRLWMACLLVGLLAAAHAHGSWAAARPQQLGPYAGWVTLVGDPTPIGAGVRITVEIEGQRFDAWLYGGTRRRVLDRQSGQELAVVGERRPLGANARRAQVRHVVGRFELGFVGDWSPGSRLALVNTRIREALRRAAEHAMPVSQAALFTGLVIGDDLRQPRETVQSFRAAGLSHLTAVSGQNVAFVLAAAAPLLRRLRAGPRWTATVGLVVWFMALTRFEPSVLRAGFMAILAATAFVLGRRQQPLRLLCLTVMVLVLLDPLLVWSVGFWLSAGATGGVIVAGPRLAQRLPGPGWFTTPLGITLGAQIGVALPSLLVFGRLPLVSVPANLLAVPVGGFVMLYGLPAGLVAAALPPINSAVMFPAVVGTRWVETVADLAARFEPGPAWTVPGWCAIGLIVGALARRSRDAPADVPI